MEKKLKLIIVAIGLICFIAGFFISSAITLEACVKIGMRLTDIHLNPDAVNKLIQHFPEIQRLLMP